MLCFPRDTLNRNAAGTLAAYTVKIDNGVQVTVSGPALNLQAASLQFTGSGGDGSTTGGFAGSGAVEAGDHGGPGTPAPPSVSPNAKSPPTPAPVGAHRPGSAGKTPQTRPVTLPFEAVQPFLVRGGPALPARLNAPAVTRKTSAAHLGDGAATEDGNH